MLTSIAGSAGRSQTKARGLEEGIKIITIVGNEDARENVCRLGKSSRYGAAAEQKEDGFYLTLRKMETRSIVQGHRVARSTVLFVGYDILGRGDSRELGSLLMQRLFHTLSTLRSRPDTTILLNNEVKLTASDPLAAGKLLQLESQGTEILACGTCSERLQLRDKVAVGKVSEMYTIADTLLGAGKVISL